MSRRSLAERSVSRSLSIRCSAYIENVCERSVAVAPKKFVQARQQTVQHDLLGGGARRARAPLARKPFAPNRSRKSFNGTECKDVEPALATASKALDARRGIVFQRAVLLAANDVPAKPQIASRIPSAGACRSAQARLRTRRVGAADPAARRRGSRGMRRRARPRGCSAFAGANRAETDRARSRAGRARRALADPRKGSHRLRSSTGMPWSSSAVSYMLDVANGTKENRDLLRRNAFIQPRGRRVATIELVLLRASSRCEPFPGEAGAARGAAGRSRRRARRLSTGCVLRTDEIAADGSPQSVTPGSRSPKIAARSSSFGRWSDPVLVDEGDAMTLAQTPGQLLVLPQATASPRSSRRARSCAR